MTAANVWCSNCACGFYIPNQTHGFSHCDQHSQYEVVDE
jgi:hypothetical protein